MESNLVVLNQIKDQLIADFSDLCGEGGCQLVVQAQKSILGPRLFVKRYQDECRKVKQLSEKLAEVDTKSQQNCSLLMTHLINTGWKYEKLKQKHKRLLDDFKHLQDITNELLTLMEKVPSV
jgi:hypothetical protein